MPAAFEIGRPHLGSRQQLGAGAAERDAAVDHHVAAVGELQRVIGVLLDQEDRQPLAAGSARAITSKICFTISGARPSEGSSSSSSRGRPISARAIASICCSPPDIVPARWSRRLARIGNSCSARARSASKVASRSLVEQRAHLQVFEHRHAREDAAALRRLGEAEAHDLVRGQSRDVAARRSGSCRRARAGCRRSSSSASSCRRRWRRSA